MQNFQTKIFNSAVCVHNVQYKRIHVHVHALILSFFSVPLQISFFSLSPHNCLLYGAENIHVYVQLFLPFYFIYMYMYMYISSG